MPSFFNRLRNVLADRRGASRAGGRYAVEMIVGISAGPATLFSHTLDVSRGGLSVFIPRVEAAAFLTGRAAPISLTLTLPQGPVSMRAAAKHVRPLKAGASERGYAVGLEITEMAGGDLAIYRSFVDGLTERLGGR